MSARARCWLLATVCLFGCGHVEVHEVVLRQPSAPQREAAVFTRAQTPPHRYYDVAILQAIGSGGRGDVESTVEALAQRAGELGCDAVVRVQIAMGMSRASATGVCVRYLAEPGR